MTFALATATLPVRDEIRAELREEWRRLGAAGTWFDSATRVAIAAGVGGFHRELAGVGGLVDLVGR